MALAVTSEAFVAAGIAITWIDCVGAGRDPGCTEVLPPGMMVLRLIAHRHADLHILGTAMVQRDGPSVLATVYTPSLVERAGATHVPVTTILGRVAAHEIAHLLLGTPSHSSSGLMRPDWNIRRTNPEDWRFSANDVQALQRRPMASEPRRAAAARTAN